MTGFDLIGSHQAGVKTLNNKHAEKEQIFHGVQKKDAIQNNMII